SLFMFPPVRTGAHLARSIGRAEHHPGSTVGLRTVPVKGKVRVYLSDGLKCYQVRGPDPARGDTFARCLIVGTAPRLRLFLRRPQRIPSRPPRSSNRA